MLNRPISQSAFELLQAQVNAALSLCSEGQMLTLADQIHETIRQRQYSKWNSADAAVETARDRLDA